jgi:protein-tyrosine phosphatase
LALPELLKVRTMLSLALLCGGCLTQPHQFPVVEVSPGIFEGPKPRSQADFDALRAKGVRTILSLEMMPWDIGPERRHAQRNGIRYRDVPILASPLEPSEKRVKAALLALHDRSLRPVFIHCLLGEDRNVFIVGLYRIYFQDWTPPAAWAEMLRSDFHDSLRLRGFTTYFWSHTRKPDWVKALRSREEEPPVGR